MEIASDGVLASEAWASESAVAGRYEDDMVTTSRILSPAFSANKEIRYVQAQRQHLEHLVKLSLHRLDFAVSS